MGDNATTSRDWHNTDVGQGYQAAGVLRQRQSADVVGKIVDMRGPAHENKESLGMGEGDGDVKKSRKEEKKEKKEKKERKDSKKEKKNKKSKKDRRDKEACFNPFLQVLASRVSNTTREFTINNGY